MMHVLAVLGTRPEVIKLAPVVHALRAAGARVTLCSTGQHREMLDSALRSFELAADIDLAVMRPGQHPADTVAHMIARLRAVFDEHRPDAVVVQGDTSTVMAASIAAYLCRTRVAHVEAGLRTGDKWSPFPEEINRRVAGVIADDHFAPTPAARDALLAEGVDPSRVHLTGNTVIDALRWMVPRVRRLPAPAGLDLTGRVVLVTAHRRESFGEPFRELCLALRTIVERFSDVRLVYPVHLNPSVRGPAMTLLSGIPRLQLVEPLDYAAFVHVMTHAHLIITDSGGVQEEAPALGKPTLVTRDKTERPEAVAAGVVRLVGTDQARIVAEASRLLADDAAYRRMARVVDVYGDGLASRRIAEVLTGARERTEEFAVSLA